MSNFCISSDVLAFKRLQIRLKNLQLKISIFKFSLSCLLKWSDKNFAAYLLTWFNSFFTFGTSYRTNLRIFTFHFQLCIFTVFKNHNKSLPSNFCIFANLNQLVRKRFLTFAYFMSTLYCFYLVTHF